ncbi:MAG: hypothetical protein Q7S13_05195, partial [Candidatus Omnitrophota bacterium]|nr:hypothetical protein [Candidatus Omnitrophota bacterium]
MESELKQKGLSNRTPIAPEELFIAEQKVLLAKSSLRVAVGERILRSIGQKPEADWDEETKEALDSITIDLDHLEEDLNKAMAPFDGAMIGRGWDGVIVFEQNKISTEQLAAYSQAMETAKAEFTNRLLALVRDHQIDSAQHRSIREFIAGMTELNTLDQWRADFETHLREIGATTVEGEAAMLAVDASSIEIGQDMLRTIMKDLKNKGQLDLAQLIDRIAPRLSIQRVTSPTQLIGVPITDDNDKKRSIRSSIDGFLAGTHIGDALFATLSEEYPSYRYRQGFFNLFFGEELAAMIDQEAAAAGFKKIVLKNERKAPGLMAVALGRSKATDLQWKAKEEELVVHGSFARQLAQVYEAEHNPAKPMTRALIRSMVNIEKAKVKIINERLSPGVLKALDETLLDQAEERARLMRQIASLSYTQLASMDNRDTWLENLALFVWFNKFFIDDFTYRSTRPQPYRDFKKALGTIVDELISGK